jgi:hypothetical protein
MALSKGKKIAIIGGGVLFLGIIAYIILKPKSASATVTGKAPIPPAPKPAYTGDPSAVVAVIGGKNVTAAELLANPSAVVVKGTNGQADVTAADTLAKASRFQ